MRLNSMNTYLPDATALTNWNITTTTGLAPLQSNYKEGSITYDRNGNILTYQRWGASASVQDNLTYSYIAGTNKLNYVGDAVAAASFTSDFDGQSTGNYTYDGAGNLTGDAQSFISAGGITWNPYGKIMQVDILGGLTQNIFAYDAMQNRVKKRKVVSGSDISTFYIRDAQGNVLAVYEKNGTTITWKEQHLYGSSRLGTVEPGVAWTSAPAATPYFRSTRILNYGWKRYEVNDHLGNVRALINDRKTYGGATFAATLLDATDYFPFGAEMRKGTAPLASYRYGFNGKELDKTEFGSLNHYDYGFRIYNPGIARFLSVDPLTAKYPELTPYQFAGNTPIQAIDLDGLEPKYFINNEGKLTKPLVALIRSAFDFSNSSLSNSVWQPYSLSVTITGRDGKPFKYYPNMAWALTVGIPDNTSASVKGSIVVHDDYQQRSDAKWLDLIVHEQSPPLVQVFTYPSLTAGTVSLTRTIIPVSSRHTSMHAGMKKAQIKLG